MRDRIYYQASRKMLDLIYDELIEKYCPLRDMPMPKPINTGRIDITDQRHSLIP